MPPAPQGAGEAREQLADNERRQAEAQDRKPACPARSRKVQGIGERRPIDRDDEKRSA